jgi:TM2 domain-containing membrane protein YozV
MFCQECGKDIPQGSKFCPECGFNYQTGSSQQGPPVIGTTQQAPPVQGDVRQTSSTPQVAPQQPSTQFDAGVSRGNSDLVYPKNPPLSPHFCWLNLIWLGIPHLVFGQTGKGILLIFINVLLICTAVGIPIAIFFVVVLTFDAFYVGKTLASGKPVGKWSFFPSP